FDGEVLGLSRNTNETIIRHPHLHGDACDRDAFDDHPGYLFGLDVYLTIRNNLQLAGYGLTVPLNAPAVAPAASVTCRSNEKSPGVVGVPLSEMSTLPSGLSDCVRLTPS